MVFRVGFRVQIRSLSVVVLSKRPLISFLMSSRTRSSRPGTPGVSQSRLKRSMFRDMAGSSRLAAHGGCAVGIRLEYPVRRTRQHAVRHPIPDRHLTWIDDETRRLEAR